MTEVAGAALLRLLAWLSPSFPVGGFAYSHGLERAVHDGLVRDAATLADWLRDLIERGSAWNDAVLMAAAWRQETGGGDAEVAQLAEALAGGRERHMETMLQGEAFVRAVAAWGAENRQAGKAAYPVAIGRAAAEHAIPLEAALVAWLHGFASNMVQAAVRLARIGQSDAVAAIAALEPVILQTAARAAGSTTDHLGSATFVSEIAAMKHETQYSRVFRS